MLMVMFFIVVAGQGTKEIIGEKRMLQRSEYLDQCAVFQWAQLNLRRFPELELLQGSLNGVRLNIGQAVKAKSAGLNAGWPDLFLPVARHGYHGLFIELNIKPYRNHKHTIVYP